MHSNGGYTGRVSFPAAAAAAANETAAADRLERVFREMNIAAAAAAEEEEEEEKEQGRIKLHMSSK